MRHLYTALLCSVGIITICSPGAVYAIQVMNDDAQPPAYCPNLTNTLQRGSRDATTGGQVSELQAFLTDYFALADGQILSGFFGRLTQSYVQQFQRAEGLPAYGLVGALTRARISEVCSAGAPTQSCTLFQEIRCNTDEEYVAGNRDAKGCATQGWCRPKAITADFYVKPEEGQAPLSVTFYAMVGGRAQYAVDFGDGTGQQLIACFAPADACVAPGKVNHVYEKPGVYVATLKRVYRIMELQPGDRIMGPLASITIRAQQKIVTPVTPDSRCRVWFDGCNTCTRDTVGGNLACTKMACVSGGATGQEPQAFCKEYFGSGKTDYPPSITGFSGPTQLDVNQDGVWKIDASDKEAQQLSYSVDWGEYRGGTQSTQVPTLFSQSVTFVHRYTQSGTYTVSITVYDTAGGSATSSATVSVGTTSGTSCTGQYQPVCGERRVCSTGECWGEQKTYSNTCTLLAENASFLYEGECRRGTSSYSPPTACRNWYDGCNTCSRATAGGAVTCTERACTTYTSGYCTGF